MSEFERTVLLIIEGVRPPLHASSYYVDVESGHEYRFRNLVETLKRLRGRGLVSSERVRVPDDPETPYVFWTLTPAGREAVRS